jgi:hypothetical protein
VDPIAEAINKLACFAKLFPTDRSVLSAKQRLDWALLAGRVVSCARSVEALLLAEAEAADAAMVSAGTPLASFLASETNISSLERRES